MSARVTQTSRYDTAVASLQRRRAELNQAMLQLTSNKRGNRPSDDPTAAASAERAFIAQQRLDAPQPARDDSSNAKAQTESALGRAGDHLQAAREQLLCAGNGTYGPGEHVASAAVLVALRGQLQPLATHPDGASGYIDAGQGTT